MINVGDRREQDGTVLEAVEVNDADDGLEVVWEIVE